MISMQTTAVIASNELIHANGLQLVALECTVAHLQGDIAANLKVRGLLTFSHPASSSGQLVW